MLSLELRGDLPPSLAESEIRYMAEMICRENAPDIDFEVSLLLVESDVMREYNRVYRGVDMNTDVLSFMGDELLLEGRQTRLCDIIIDTNQVVLQKGSKTIKEEFWLVLIHGLLHITGYDHIKTADKKKMEDAEDNYRKQIPGGGIA